jgi:SAM-dependent methyltransferase
MGNQYSFRNAAKTILRKLLAVDRRTELARLRATPIPIPPPEFRALVNGQPIAEEHHAQIGLELFDLLRDQCSLQPSSIVLDIGCGCGRVTTPLTNFLHEGVYHGVDIVLPMVKWCQKNITVRHPSFHFHHADLANTLYRNKGRRADQMIRPFPPQRPGSIPRSL